MYMKLSSPPFFQNLPPVVSVGVGVCSSKNSLVAVSFRQQLLIPLVLKCDYSSVKSLLEHLKGGHLLEYNIMFNNSIMGKIRSLEL